MSMWPSVHDFEGSLCEDFDDVKINMATFGGFSRKTTSFSGNWPGLHVLRKVNELMVPLVKDRELLQLTKRSGKWRCRV